MTTPTHNIVYRPVSEIHELEGNPRVIKKDQFEKLKTSIKNNPDYFEARPCILSNRTGVLVVIAGNQRLRASRELGMTEVPTILLEGLTEEREREIIVRDNVENGEWDYDVLANQWESTDLEDWGVEGVFKTAPFDAAEFFQDRPETETNKSKTIKCPNCGHEFEA